MFVPLELQQWLRSRCSWGVPPLTPLPSRGATTCSRCSAALVLMKNVEDMIRQLSSCRPLTNSGPNNAPRGSTGSMKNSAARAMLYRLSTTSTWRSASTPESPGITLITPLVLWGRSPKSLTSTRRAVTRKIARSPSLLWAWPQPALWHTRSQRNPPSDPNWPCRTA